MIISLQSKNYIEGGPEIRRHHYSPTRCTLRSTIKWIYVNDKNIKTGKQKVSSEVVKVLFVDYPEDLCRVVVD